MKRFFLGVLFVLGGCSLPGNDSVSQVSESPGRSEISMPLEQNIPDLKRRALDGGKVEALQLALWYMKFPKGHDTFEFWTLIAAENGSDVGQYNLGILYASYSEDDYRHDRARYWLTTSAQQGNTAAENELDKLAP